MRGIKIHEDTLVVFGTICSKSLAAVMAFEGLAVLYIAGTKCPNIPKTVLKDHPAACTLNMLRKVHCMTDNHKFGRIVNVFSAGT